MKKLLFLMLSIFFLGGLQAQTESLTFRVDANNITTLSPNGIHVAGSWQSEANGDVDWVPGANMMDDADDDGIYELTVSVPAGFYEYKFINGNDWSENPEGVPPACAVNGNRSVEVVSGGVTTDLVCFSSCEECPAVGGGDVNATFSVNASLLGSIDPAGIHIAGTFNGFSPEPMTDAGGGVYTLTTMVPSNSTVLYKFTNSADFSGVESVPGACGQDDGFGGNNRFVDVVDEDVVVPTVCFSACSDCTTPGETYELTLLVDASQLAAISDTGLHAAGTFNGFSPTQMTDEGGGIYSISATVEEGSTVLWKYINGATFDDEVETVPGDCGQDDGFGGFNRVLTMPSADTTAGPVCFSQCVECEVAPENYTLTLIVDASDLDTLIPEGIHVAGTFNGFSPTAMTDDGSGIYSLSVQIAEGSTVLYKYLNSTDFSAAEEVPEACGADDGFGGFNRTLTMPSADTTAGPVCFGSCEACPTAPPCTNPYPQVDFNSLTSTNLPNGRLRFDWDFIPGQLGCQINILVGEGPQQATLTRIGAENSSLTLFPNLLVPFTTYNFRVRCGCSTSPFVVGPYTEYAAAFYLPPLITEEMGTAYADTPVDQLNDDNQWVNANLGSNVIGEIFAMKTSESWVRVAPNPAQDNVNLSYNALSEGQGLIQVFDAQGKLAFERIMTFNKGLNNVNLNLNELENGIYIVEVLKGDSRESVRLFMQ